jgi:hypothetical protein
MANVNMHEEERLRDLLHALADDQAPPSRVDVAAARQVGRRQRRIRPPQLPWVAPIAAAAAVAAVAVVVAQGGAVGPLGHRAVPEHARAPMTVPIEFTPEQAVVSFGWLPPGFTADGVAQLQQDPVNGTEVQLQANAPLSDGRSLTLNAFAASACKLTGSQTLPQLIGRQRGDVRTRKVTYAHVLSCADGAQAIVWRNAARVNGGTAYQGPGGQLIWEYGRDAWAELAPAANAYVVTTQASPALRSWLYRPSEPQPLKYQLRPRWVQSADSWQLLRETASRLRFNFASLRLVYGFTISGLPASWGTGSPSGLTKIEGRFTASWQAGPAVDSTALNIWAAPAVGQPTLHCNPVAGQTEPITLDGAQGTLRTMNFPDKHWQELCMPDLDGMQLMIQMDRNVPGSDRPLPGGAEISSIPALMQHIRLLGPAVKDWRGAPDR